MDPNHPYSDYIRDVPMEIHSDFYPPPTILLPSVDIRLYERHNTTEVNFNVERQTIKRYGEESRVNEDAYETKAQSFGQESTARPVSPGKGGRQLLMANEADITTAPSTIRESQSLLSSASTVSYPELVPTPAQIVPTISPIERILNVSRSSSQQTHPVEAPLAQQAPKRHIFELEEFEVRRNDIFDIVTRSSLNDRAELEKLLS